MNVLNLKEMAALQGGRKGATGESVTRAAGFDGEVLVDRIQRVKNPLTCQ